MSMKAKFFLEGHYKMRLDNVQPKEAKPNRIHLQFAMLLIPDELKFAPTQIRRLYDIVDNPELDVPNLPVSTKLKGIDIEIYPTPPTAKSVPVLVTLSGCVLRDIRIHREDKQAIRLYFSVGVSWNRKIWKWGGDNIFLECFAKFYESQQALIDENEADESLSTPLDPAKVDAAVEDLKRINEVPGLIATMGSPRMRSKRGKTSPN